ncbi:hypothetical protein A6R68_04974, partial [Neotoma lepida]
PTIKSPSPSKHFIRDTNQQILVLQGSTLVAVPDKRGKRGGPGPGPAPLQGDCLAPPFSATVGKPRQPVGVTKELGKQKNTQFEFVDANVDLREIED